MKNEDTLQDRHRDILEAAELVFTTRGFAAARMDDIAETAGVAKGTLYLYFRSKQVLFVELLETRAEEYVTTLDAYLREAKSLADCLGILATLRGQLFVKNQRLAESISHSVPDFPRELQWRVWNIRRALQRPTEKALERFLPADYPVPPSQTAAIVNGAIDYLVGVCVLDGEQMVLSEVAKDIQYVLLPGLSRGRQDWAANES